MVMGLLVSVILFHLGRFGSFLLVISVVSLVSVISFQWFSFVVLVFSTCPMSVCLSAFVHVQLYDLVCFNF